MTKNSSASVIILTKNSSSTLEACLKSIAEQGPGEVLAVDALSTDNTTDILSRYKVSILIDDRKSLGYARRLGVESSHKPLVMFVDSDVVLGPRCISIMISELTAHGWAGIHAKMLSRQNETYWQRAEDENFAAFNKEGPKDHIGTIAALFRRELLVKYPFDPNLDSACEDIDVCRRLRNDGYVVGVSTAIAYHLHRREFREIFKQGFRNGRGDAKLALKSGSISIAFGTTQNALYQNIKSMFTLKFRLIPYWAVIGLAGLTGALLGLSSGYGDTSRTAATRVS